MTIEKVNRLLEYLKKQGSANTFLLARELDINRHKLIEIIRDLEKKGALEFKSGVAKFLNFPIKEKSISRKPAKIKKIQKTKKRAKPKKTSHEEAIKRKLKIIEDLQDENKKLEDKLAETRKTIKELEEKANAPPKIIRKTIIKKIPVKPKKKKSKPKIRKKNSWNFKINLTKLKKELKKRGW